MARDGFDRLIWLGFAAAAATLAVLLLTGGTSGQGRPGQSALDREMERQIADQARIDFLERTFGAVEESRKQGDLQRALLQLEELNREFSGEAHGYILKGMILDQMGALEESIASYVRGVRMNGDYIDQRSALSRRAEIRRVVERGLDEVGERARLHPDNPSLGEAMKNVYYLQSRLAGGCE